MAPLIWLPRHRRDTWKPQRIVYADKRQQLHFPSVSGLDTAGLEVDQELVHVWFGTLNLPGGAMSSRSGNIIRLAEFMDEGVLVPVRWSMKSLHS